MNCPVDGNELRMTERHGVEIDYCPTCRGVWLDRGELDKILERSASPSPENERHRDGDERDRDTRQEEYRDEREFDDQRDRHGRRPKRRRSLLEELLDFG